jgi:hypothetical protein
MFDCLIAKKNTAFWGQIFLDMTLAKIYSHSPFLLAFGELK